jgi:hypothetical protein
MAELTQAQKRFVAADKRMTEAKQILQEYSAAVAVVVAESGVGAFFQDDEGTVYKTTTRSTARSGRARSRGRCR